MWGLIDTISFAWNNRFYSMFASINKRSSFPCRPFGLGNSFCNRSQSSSSMTIRDISLSPAPK